jgi:hypothetical protein
VHGLDPSADAEHLSLAELLPVPKNPPLCIGYITKDRRGEMYLGRDKDEEEGENAIQISCETSLARL